MYFNPFISYSFYTAWLLSNEIALEEADAGRCSLSTTDAGPSVGNKSGFLAVETPIQTESVPGSPVLPHVVSVGAKS